MSVTKPAPSMRFRIAAAVALLVLVLILVQSLAMLMLFDDKEEEFIEALLSQQINYSMSVWPTNPASAFPNTPDMKLYLKTTERPGANEPPVPFAHLSPGSHEVYLGQSEFHVVVREDDNARYFLVYDVKDHEKRQRETGIMTLMGACFLGLLALVSAYGVAGRLSGRLERLAARVGSHEPGALSEPGMEKELLAVAAALDVYRQRQDAMLRRERAFAANLSHELRSPLTAIRTDAELLATLPNLPETALRRANRVISSVDRINRLAASLLMLAREAKVGLAEEILLKPAIQSVWDSLLSVEPKPVSLRLVMDESARLDADPVLFNLVVRNLFENALRYSDQGEVLCVLAANGLRISDSGPGFSPEDLPHVFDRFFMGERGVNGLGLALVRHVCTACAWRVSAGNNPTGGAYVEIEFGQRLHMD